MTNISKRLLTAFLAVAAAVCLTIGLFLAVPQNAYAADNVTADVVLDGNSGYLNIEGNKLVGLKDKDAGNTLVNLLSGNTTFKLVVPAGVTEIDAGNNTSVLGVYVTKLVDLDLANVQRIGGRAFYGCNAIKTITIPASVTNLGTEAFGACRNVTEINYNATKAFNGSSIYSPFNGVGGATVNIAGTASAPITSVPQSLFRGTAITSVTINNVNTNEQNFWGVFENCANLKKVTFGDNCRINTIGQRTFAGCSSLRRIEIPSSVTKVDDTAFVDCTDLLEVKNPQNLTLNLPDNVLHQYSTGETWFVTENDFEFFYDQSGAGKALLTGYYGSAAELTLPAQTPAAIGPVHYDVYKDTFRGNTNLKTVTIPAGADSLGANVFYGCTSLEEVNMDDSNITLIGDSAFYGCTSLINAHFSNVLEEVGRAVFYGCTSLADASLPATTAQIDTYAFYGCTSLNTLEILTESKTISGSEVEYCALYSIGANSFENCVSLEEITIPTHRESLSAGDTVFGSYSFRGCINLGTVYLPEKATFNSEPFDGCAENILLIAPSKQAYDAYNKNIKGKFTYEVTVELLTISVNMGATARDIGGENGDTISGEVSDGNKYYFDVQATDPVQDGYKTSVWYKDSRGTTKAKTLTEELAVEGVESITLYAYEIEKPDVSGKLNFSINYNGEQTIDGNWFDGWKAGYDLYYTFEVSSYYDMSHKLKDVGNVKAVSDAGEYGISLLLNNEEKYGQWEEGVQLSIVVNPMLLQNDSLQAFLWGVNGANDSLEGDENTFVRVTDNDPQIEEGAQSVDKDNGIYSGYSSILYYNASEQTLLLCGTAGSDHIVSITYYDNSKTDRGMWVSYAIVVLDNNYTLPTGSGSLTGVDFESRNIEITYNYYTNSYTISKTWFIIAADGNKLVDINDLRYTIDGWQYSKDGGDEVIPAPRLLYGNDSINTLVSYELVMNDTDNITNLEKFEFKHVDFAKYLNGSMPAGSYTLLVSIENYTDKETGIEYVGTGATPFVINFTVRKADMLPPAQALGDIWTNKELLAVYTGEKTFGDAGMPVLAMKGADIHPVAMRERINGNIWNEPINVLKYYRDFEISYRVVGNNRNDVNYFTYDNHTNAPREVGRYYVYYNIYTYSYDSTLNDSSITRYYVLTIQGAIDMPVITVQYNGESWVDNVMALANTGIYEVYYLDDSTETLKQLRLDLVQSGRVPDAPQEADKYVDAGWHWVLLKMTDSGKEIATWNDNGEVIIVNSSHYGEFAAFRIQITQATNVTTQHVSMSGWEWGETPAIPSWSTRFGENDGITYEYVLVSQSNDSKVYYSNPTGEQLGFDKADAGNYWLKPIARGNNNVKDLDTRDDTYSNDWTFVTVSAANITWASTPRIDSFKYGDDKIFKLPAGELNSKFSEVADNWTRYFCLAEDYESGKTIDKSIDTMEKLLASLKVTDGRLPSNNYVFVYELPAGFNTNYDDWSYPVFFSVIKAENYWETAPVINSFNYGDENALSIIYQPHFGDARNVSFTFWYVDQYGVEQEVNYTEATQFIAGNYKYRVTLSGSDNYEYLEFPKTEFEVFQSQNSWVKIPDVIGWNQGWFDSEKNTPTATAEFGTVVFTILDADGNVVKGFENLTADQLNSQKLNSLDVGTYTLVAKVNGDHNYTGLESVAHFAVFEDSVGMTGLIAATMVFAVIAVGLAVAATILLIRRHKKIEQEFRDMVRAELKRR